MSENILSINVLEKLAQDALINFGAGNDAAYSVAKAIVRAESEGNYICGLLYTPLLCEQLKVGKIKGKAKPSIDIKASAAITVDASDGLAHPAIELGLPHLQEAALSSGIAAMTVKNSTNCLALSHFLLPLAQNGLIGLGFANCPAVMAPLGGKTPILGTNPIAMAVPGVSTPKIVIDQSTSAVAMTELILRRDSGHQLEEGWALDSNGKPTVNPSDGLAGSMLPSGGYKGFGIALMVEVLSAALSGAQLSSQASPYFGDKGGPSQTGQCVIAINPMTFNPNFLTVIDDLCSSIESQEGSRLPGKIKSKNYNHAKKHGLSIEVSLVEQLRSLST
ncbi:Ldh family oxidoreductase [Kiloniella majae]|uniref:Ldh family oxidoreductase n=1 Tax=Kiloniella majae TaxID=1938558 RepID=UPI000A278C75|nr:Ldh family oxidoreductase [Kiloniella majae]